MIENKTLSEKIQNQLLIIAAYRFDTDITSEQFADATTKIEDDIKQFIKDLKDNWRKKARKMEVLSGEVAIFELECEIEDLAGPALCANSEVCNHPWQDARLECPSCNPDGVEGEK